MQFKDLYQKGLDCKVNPAVSASDTTEETIHTEISEYVFTEEIIINLYKVLLNIKTNQGDHVGIWINGYYGSGKSHFLKYASYCLSGIHSELAFDRLIEATQEYLNNSDGLSPLEDEGVSVSDLKSLREWYAHKADVEMVMFNIGDVHNANGNQAAVFSTIFWNEFNKSRGFNSFNLALAQHLEKALADDGKFDEFKAHVASKGFDWERHITRFAAGKLDKALEMAKEVDPALAIDVIREKVKNNDINVSVEVFAEELREYIEKKDNRNFRLLFFVDEVSQFISDNSDTLLQLQSLVKRLEEVCHSQVWIACTAQQTLDDVVQKAGNGLNDEIGKILGRFEVRASLQSTKPEYITQKRILEKTGEAELQLTSLFDQKKNALDAQFVLPASYKAFTSKEEFANYYPFVPYQFTLIQKVLASFSEMGYVDKQVKDSERSLLNITFSIARETAEEEVGHFVPFDRFFGVMFQGSMQHLGQRAIANANQALANMAGDEKMKAFYRRVVNVMFMICNLADQDKPTFLATIDNIVTLLMTEIDQTKDGLKYDVEQVLNFLMDQAVIRRSETDSGTTVYEFYTEEEAKVAGIIKNISVDANTYNTQLWKLIDGHVNPDKKIDYCTRSFKIGGAVDDKHVLDNAGDVDVHFLTNAQTDNVHQFALTNDTKRVVYFLYPQLKADQQLRNDFLEYCRIQKFKETEAVSAERQKLKLLFSQRADEMMSKHIKGKFETILNTCEIISGTDVVSPDVYGQQKGKDRFKTIMQAHLKNFYPQAELVNSSSVPRNSADLSAKIMRDIEPGLPVPLSAAETQVLNYLNRQPHDVSMADVVRYFAKNPYGWSEVATIYITNELVRRHLYAFNYKNTPDVSREAVANKIMREQASFTLEKAKAISQETINAFIEAWKKIFNVVTVKGSNDETELYRYCKEREDSDLHRLLTNYNALARKIGDVPFRQAIDNAINLMDGWKTIRDHQKFFETIAADCDTTALLFDQCKKVNTFVHGQWDKFTELKQFINDQRDNFGFLSEQLQSVSKSLRQLLSDDKPWDNMPAYIKMRKQLEFELKKKKAELEGKIDERYNKVFDELEQYAKSVGVSLEKFARRDSILTRMKNTPSFSRLQLNAADADRFFAEQMDIINKAIPAPQPTPPAGGDGGNGGNGDGGNGGDPQPPTPPTPPVRKRKIMSVSKFRTTQPMKTEADIDLYLAGLRAEMMQMIGDSDIIIN